MIVIEKLPMEKESKYGTTTKYSLENLTTELFMELDDLSTLMEPV